MKKITLFLFALFASWQINAQVSSYAFSQSNGTFTPITGGAVLGTATANGSLDSYNSSALTLPFSFNFNGTAVSTVFMNSNGFISLGNTAPSTFTSTPISTASTATGIVAAFAGDLNTFFNIGSRTGEMRWETVGTSPNREIVFQWTDFRPAYSTSTTNAYGFSFQVRLAEDGNVVKVVYGPGSFAIGTTAVTGTTNRQIGLRGTTTSDFNNRVFTNFSNPSTAGTLNSSANSFSTATNFPGAGLTLQWTPPTPCSGTPVAGTITPALQNICSGTTPANLVATGFSSGVTGLTFQWEESNDDGATDAWAPVVGGTGATTPTYTPPAFSGTPIYYRLNVTCTNSTTSAQTASVLVSTPTAPSNQATAVTIPAATVNYDRAVINWTNGNGTRRVVYVSDSPIFIDPVNGNAPALVANALYSGSGQQIIFDGTGTTVTVTGLATGTQYYIKVYEYLRCGAGPFDYYYNVTTGTNVGTFTTCGAFVVPSLEDFTTYVPGCWQEAYNGDLVAGPLTFGSSSWAADGFGNVDTTGATKINLDSTGDNDWILSPLYTIPTTGYELKFDAAATQWGTTNPISTAWETDDFVQVLVSTGTTNWTILYTYDNTNVPSNTGTPNIIDLDAYAGQTVRFAFRGVEGATNGGADVDFSIDNFQIRLTPPCIEPTTLTATNITSSGADLSWVDPSGIQFDYELVVQLAGGDAPTVAGDIVDIDTLPLTINTLNPNTNYEFWVRANCGVDGNSAWVGPVTFRTTCANFVAPWTYNVESATVTTNSSISDCWTSSPTNTTSLYRWDVDGAGSTPSSGTGPSGAYSGSKYFYTEASSGATGAIAYLTPISIDVTALTTPYLEFYYHMFGADMGTLEVEVYNGTTWTSVWSLSGQQQTSETAPWLSAGINMSSHVVSNVLTFRFKATRGADFEGDMSLDNISVIEAPACLPPTNLSVGNITATSANLIWTESGTATSWDIEWGTLGFTPTGTPTISGATNPQSISGLSSNTTYSFYVRSNCGAGGYSTWSGPFSFTTACVAENVPYSQNFETATVPNLPSCTSQQNVGSGNLWTVENNPGYGFTNKALLYIWNSSNNANVWFYTNGINLTAGTTYRVSYSYGGTAFYPEKLKVAYGTAPLASAMTTVLADYPNVINDTPNDVFVDFTPTVSGVYYFGFNAYSDADQFYLIVDNILVDVALSNTDFDNSNFIAYPNPVKDVLNVSYSTEISSIRVINMIGQEVISRNVNASSTQVDMSELSAGTYIVNVTLGDAVKTLKVVKQ